MKTLEYVLSVTRLGDIIRTSAVYRLYKPMKHSMILKKGLFIDNLLKRILLHFIIALNPINILGQNTNITRSVLNGNGYTYYQDITNDTEIISLYNKENKYIGTPLVYKATGERPPLDIREKRVEDDNWSYDRSEEIINNAFSAEQKSIISGRTFMVSIYIDSTSGRILDVEFAFPKRYPYAQIPLSVYRKIEMDLKEYIYFTPTEAGKKLNYILFGWMHEVK